MSESVQQHGDSSPGPRQVGSPQANRLKQLSFCNNGGNMIPALETSTGFLPLGRYLTDLASVKAEFVSSPSYATSTRRSDIWDEFESATTELRRIVPVCSVWISGSFLSVKSEPDDLDVMYWCEDRHIDAIDPGRTSDLQVLQAFAQNQLRAALGLRIDTRIGYWHARPEPAFTNSPSDRQYTIMRGFWDDFWLRTRSGGKTDPPVRADAIPKRGYLEVMLDGHDVA